MCLMQAKKLENEYLKDEKIKYAKCLKIKQTNKELNE